MKEFFQVTQLDQVFGYVPEFQQVESESIQLREAAGRVIADNLMSDVNLPDFPRATMDGYAVNAQSTFGASEANPAYLTLKGVVAMAESPVFDVKPGEAAKISTGGMLPEGANSVAMIEHTQLVDESTVEVYRSVAPGQHVIETGEDIAKGEKILARGSLLRPQEIGLLAAFGRETVKVYRKPVVSIISTGDEIVPIDERPGPGKIRDINTYTLAGLVQEAGGTPVMMGIVRDHFDSLYETSAAALSQSDMVLISGGSSVGTRDFTIEVLSSLPYADILVHGITISPGKPTILAKVGQKAFWGLPGHVASAMVVFGIVVRPFIEHIAGRLPPSGRPPRLKALLSRNLASAQGRVDYIRVRFVERDSTLWAEPILGKSGLISTMVKADGLIEIGMNTEGLDKGAEVSVTPV